MASSVTISGSIIELEKVVDALAPDIEGLDALTCHLDPALGAFFTTSIVAHNRRLGLVVAALDALRDLESDGYPGRIDTRLPGNLYEDLQERLNAIRLGGLKFSKAPVASKIAIDLGAPIAKE